MTPDWNAVVVALITAAQAALITVVVWGTKKLLPKLPRAILPVLAMGLGVLAEYILGLKLSGPIQGALLGALAVWLHEVKTTVQQHGTQP